MTFHSQIIEINCFLAVHEKGIFLGPAAFVSCSCTSTASGVEDIFKHSYCFYILILKFLLHLQFSCLPPKYG